MQALGAYTAYTPRGAVVMPNTQSPGADIAHVYDDGEGEVEEDMVEDLADALVSFQPQERGYI